ncbi:MAG: class II aldolase/adducin family protein [bacterium]|nr:class II aldolase/adducin family protein [bacterium]
MREEGVIKFDFRNTREPLARSRYAEIVCPLIAWREILALTGLVGQDRARYEGAGYGNVSVRLGRPGMALGRRSFLITGTQTSGKHSIGLDDFCIVERYDFDRNQLVSRGLTPPSSESMTHGAVYDLGPHIRCVLHAHSPVLWNRRRELRLPETSPAVPYGTPEMAREVQRLYREGIFAERRVLAMGGHEDGIVAFGRSPEDAGQALLTWLARAYEQDCRPGAELCRT